MESNGELLKEELIIEVDEPLTQYSLLLKLGDLLENLGYVKDSFPGAVLKREREFPTGLPTDGVGVAIPHADAVHVKAPAIAVALLKDPIIFQCMSNPDQNVAVRLVFMMAIKDPHKQVNMLQRLVGILKDKDQLMSLYNSKTRSQFVELFNSYL